MITLPSARRRADEFAAALDAPAAATSTTTGTTPTPEIATLVEVVGALRTHAAEVEPTLTPRPEFTAQLRARLLAEAAETWSYDPAVARLELRSRPASRRERRLVVAATALVMAGGTAGMAAAAQQSLPGEALYPVKRGLEVARADLTSDDAAKGRTLLQQADGRLVEINTLLQESSADPAVGSTLETYLDQARSGSDLLIETYSETGAQADVDDVRGFALNGLSQLEALSAIVPADLRGELDAAADALREIDARAADACPTCSPADARAASASFRPALDDAARVLASLDGSTLSNDHPLISPRIASPSTARPGADRPADATPPSAGDAGAVDDGVEALPDGDDVRGGLGLPGLGGVDARSPGAGGVTKKVEDGVKDVEDTVRKGTKTVKDTVDDVTDSLLDPRLP